MDEVSLAKRRKTSGLTYSDFQDELDTVRELRKHTVDFMEKLYSEETRQYFKKLESIEFEEVRTKSSEVSDLCPIVQDLKRGYKESDKTCEHLRMLKIMERNKKCPIAKMINDI